MFKHNITPVFHGCRPHIMLLCLCSKLQLSRVRTCEIVLSEITFSGVRWGFCLEFTRFTTVLWTITSVVRVKVLRVYLCVVASFLRFFSSRYLFIYLFFYFFCFFIDHRWHPRDSNQNILYLNVTRFILNTNFARNPYNIQPP